MSGPTSDRGADGHQVLEGLTVLDLSSGVAGPVATMLLADYGADVIRVERPGGSALQVLPGNTVWQRGKRSVEIDLTSPDGLSAFLELCDRADIVIESYRPGTADRLGVGFDALHRRNPRLIYCSITGYGRTTSLADRPGYDGLVHARTGAHFEQIGHREGGPIFFHLPLPSLGAALMATCAISAALVAREKTGRGQWVETSLFQGHQAWSILPHSRVEHAPPGFHSQFDCPKTVGTPCYPTADRWIHPMPEVAPAVLEAFGLGPEALPGAPSGPCEKTIPFQAALRALLQRWPAQRWIDWFAERDLRCQLVQSVEEAFAHEQVLANGVVMEVETLDHGVTKQFGAPYTLERHVHVVPNRAPTRGEHTDEVLGGLPTARVPSGGPSARQQLAHPLAGIRVLDFGLALAGPFGPALLGDLGADVIRVDNIVAPRSPNDQTWAACQRGKRSVTLNLKTPAGQEVVRRLVAGADVIHHNMRPGVAERLGIGYGQVSAVNPRIVYCNVTGFGPTGPLASAPGCDQLGQALVGLEYEQGAASRGGSPTWYRYGITDHAAAILSVVGVVQALYERERTGKGQLVETNIVNAASFLSSDAFLPADADESIRMRMDASQTGFGPLYRLYETADGWICLCAASPSHWDALLRALPGVTELRSDAFATTEARGDNAEQLAALLAATFATRPATEWFARLDAEAIPIEVCDNRSFDRFFDDQSFVDAGMVASYEHPNWGLTEQHGTLFSFSETPARLFGPPVIPGQHGREILASLGYSVDEVDGLEKHVVTSFPD